MHDARWSLCLAAETAGHPWYLCSDRVHRPNITVRLQWSFNCTLVQGIDFGARHYTKMVWPIMRNCKLLNLFLRLWSYDLMALYKYAYYYYYYYYYYQLVLIRDWLHTVDCTGTESGNCRRLTTILFTVAADRRCSCVRGWRQILSFDIGGVYSGTPNDRA